MSPAALDAMGFLALGVLRAGDGAAVLSATSDLHAMHARVTVGGATYGAGDLLAATRLAAVALRRDDVVAWIDAQREALRRAPTIPAPPDGATRTVRRG